MKKFLLMACAGLFALSLTVQDAEAKRLGGGAAKGMQRESVTQKQTAPQPSPQTVAAQTANPLPVPAPRSNWMGSLAGLAAGLGLAALLSHFGLGEGLADLLMILIVVAAAIFALGMLFRKRPLESDPMSEPMQYAGIGGPSMGPPGDAIALSSSGTSSTPASVAAINRAIPADFDQDGFLRLAKLNFIRLQAANDAGNLDDIREFTTHEMFAEIRLDFADRQGATQATDIVTLDAELLEVLNEPARHVASVRFRGMIREEKNAAAQPFDEVWDLLKPADGSRGWVLAGIQPLLN